MKIQLIEDVKHFNRFYTRAIGIFNLYNSSSKYSATEAMILYEIKNTEDCTASYLSEYFQLDKSTISKALSKLSKNSLVNKKVYEQDKRVQILFLTKEGEDVLNYLASEASNVVGNIVENVTDAEAIDLLEAMKVIERILKKQLE
ncbi:MarR family winged helix-turn-helix transcriptional regulator [Bacillus ndiopicus]|uniref:MarR family winged helix-turn-helix transcriptional regulator n=1 Tax=Bacillus ndiopicus TaxID=1347368 RepID=UPI0005A8A7B6|nr:MarR family winged helix-turn-helix transcriptional regulator [Bacillus ndiopicus]